MSAVIEQHVAMVASVLHIPPIVILVVGLVTVLRFVFSLVHTILSNAHRWFIRSSVKPTKYGEWAIVTGASDGVGKA